MKNLLVRDWMTKQVITGDTELTLPEAHELMKEHGIRRLPITRNGKLVGIVTRSDIRGAQPSSATSLSIWEMNYLLSKLTMGKIMTEAVFTITPDATLKDAATIMHDKKVGALPVVADGQIAGVITESDVFRAMIAGFDKDESG
ncbi:MAG: CBS domain-containing protein [Anaerolineales bacterium]